MKRLFAVLLTLCMLGASAVAKSLTTNGGVTLDTADLPYCTADEAAPVVYFISDISAESLVKAYQALGVELPGKVGVKMSTGESERSNYLRPALIADLIHLVNGTIVECNTAYGGSRASTAMHRQQAKDNGLTEVAELDILDEEDSMEIPIEGGVRINVDYVGSHFANYDSFLVLTHFKGHAIAGELPDLTAYDTVLIGYPIWWGDAPRILSTFVENVELADKTLAVFFTSGSSGLGSSMKHLQEQAGAGTWLEGKRFTSRTTAEELVSWAKGLGIEP